MFVGNRSRSECSTEAGVLTGDTAGVTGEGAIAWWYLIAPSTQNSLTQQCLWTILNDQ